MHDTAEATGKAFLRRYSRAGHVIVEIGAYNVNGSIRPHAHPEAKYIGVDIEAGPDVDMVATDDIGIPIPSKSADIVIATSVFEHSSFFWLTMLEMLRIAKDGAVLYVSAPSNGIYHRYPNDNWRFYPDAGKMLERWGTHNGFNVRLVESFIAERMGDMWNDFVAIFQLEPVVVPLDYLSDWFACTNVWRLDSAEPSKLRETTEDMELLERAKGTHPAHDQSAEVSPPDAPPPDASPADASPAPAAEPVSLDRTPEPVQFKSAEVLDQEKLIDSLRRMRADTGAAEAWLRVLIARQNGLRRTG